jgi:outer membrane immunogenic protein
MKRLLLAGVGWTAVAVTSVIAADMPGRSLPMPRGPTYVPFFSWNGFYLGLNAGYGFGDSSWTDRVTQASTGNFKISGPMIGGTAGYNIQFGSAVFGVEGDLDWTNIKGSATTVCAGACETSNRWLGTARGRIGYAFDRFLPYFTGGAAFGDVKGTIAGVGSFSTTNIGWTLGGGLEYAFVNNWSAKLEYFYVDLGRAVCNTACSGGDPFDVTFKTNLVRAGVNYKF